VSDNLSKSQWQYTEANSLPSHAICQYASICLRLSRSLGLSLLSLVTKWICNRRPSFLFLLLFRYNIMIMTTIDSDPKLIFRQKTIINLLKGHRQYCQRSAFCACHGLTAESSDARGRVLYNDRCRRHFNRHNSCHRYVFNYGTSETFELVRLFITKSHSFSAF